mgnify:CR=1 FL=1
MSEISVRIDRQKISAQEGQNLLTALKENEIELPVLFSLVDHYHLLSIFHL